MQEQVTDKLLRVAQECDDITQAVHDVLVADENTDIPLTDGTTTPSLSKRVKQLGGQVTKVVDKVGEVSAADIAEALELGSAATYDVADLPLPARVKAEIPTFMSASAGVDPVTGVADGAYFNVRSSSDESYVDEYQNIGGVPTPSGKSYPSSAFVEQLSEQVANVAEYTALPYVVGKTYAINERVQLENGDIVKNTVDGNTVDPNVDMTGWVKTSDASQIFTLTALNQEMFNQRVERQTVTHSVYLVDYLTRQQWEAWKADNASVDFTVALEAAIAALKAKPTNGISIGLGKIIFPKGNIYLNTRQIALSNMYGLFFEGQGSDSTIIRTSLQPTGGTKDSLFRVYSYMYLEFEGLTFSATHKNLSLLRINGDGGGRELYFNGCTTYNFKYIFHYENTINEDTNFLNRCTFGTCVSVVYARNNQAIINTVMHCTFGEVIDKVFDIVGYGYTTIIGGNAVNGGKFYHVGSDAASYYGQVVTMIGTKFEYGNNGKQQIITTDNNPNTYVFAKLINCGLVGSPPDPNVFQFDVAGKLKIEIDGGQWPDTKMRLGQSVNMNSSVTIKNCTQVLKNTNISFLQYQSGWAYGYPAVYFKNNFESRDMVHRHENCASQGSLSAINVVSLRGAVLLQAGSTTPNTHIINLRGAKCLVNSLDLYIRSWYDIAALKVTVFADDAFTIPLNTEQTISLPAASGSSPVKFNIPLTTQGFTDKIYIRITNANLYGVISGHFKLDTEFV